MNFEYFIENGRFKAKRLPATRGSVKIKDNTDLYDLRDYLKEANGINESIEAYKHCFDEAFMYEVEVETFDEYFNRNPNRFLSGAVKLKGNYALIKELREWDEEEQGYGWIFVDEALGRQLQKLSLIDVKGNINEDDWIEFIKNKYRIQDMKELGVKYSVPLKGNKLKMAEMLFDSIQSGLIDHDRPFLIRPRDNLENELQENFVSEVELALSGFDYPDPYIGAVWDMVLTDNSEYPVLVKKIEEKFGKYITKEELHLDGVTPNKVDIDGFSITITSTYSDSKERSPLKKINLTETDIQFDYKNRENVKTTRIVNVSTAWKDAGLVYFNGHCRLRNEPRTFRLDGISGNMINTTTGESIDPIEIKHINEFRNFIEPMSVVRRLENIDSSKPKNNKSNFGVLVLGLALVLVLVLVVFIV